MTLDAAIRGRQNNLDLIRTVAAVSVIFSHAFPLSTGQSATEPLFEFTRGQARLGGVAVAVFFIASGLLIAQSWERSRSLLVFAWARFLRIVPGLVVSVLFCTFVVGPLFTELALGRYFSDANTYAYRIWLPVWHLPVQGAGRTSAVGVISRSACTSTLSPFSRLQWRGAAGQ